MTTFEDGPAKGQVLNLRRCARFLRVTQCGTSFDALDQLHDDPTPNELLFAYEIVGKPSMGFVDGTKYRGPMVWAHYRFVPEQPSDGQMRSLMQWRDWCIEQQAQRPMEGVKDPFK